MLSCRRRSARSSSVSGGGGVGGQNEIVGRYGRESVGFAPPPLPAEVQGRVTDDPQEPRLETALRPKPWEVGQRLDEPVLDGVQGVRFVAEQAIGHVIGDDPIPAEQLVEGRLVGAADPGEQHLVRSVSECHGRVGIGHHKHKPASCGCDSIRIVAVRCPREIVLDLVAEATIFREKVTCGQVAVVSTGRSVGPTRGGRPTRTRSGCRGTRPESGPGPAFPTRRTPGTTTPARTAR